MDLTQIITIILAAVFGTGGGLVTAYIALRKLPVERRIAEVSAQRGEVDIQAIFLEVNKKVQKSYGEIIDELREHIDELTERLDKQRGEFTLELSSHKTIIEDLKIRLRQTEQRLKETESLNSKLVKRVEALEAENKALKAERDRLLTESA
jgi:chromosome segregation ATPase